MKKVFAILFFVMILILLLVPSTIVFAESTEAYHIYVDASANAKKADGSAKHPFATIKDAKEYVKTLDKTKGDIVVEIKDGIYYIDETLVFTSEDSGNSNCTIKYKAAEGARPLLCGGEKVEGKWKNEGDGIYSISYNRDTKLRALYVNGKRCYMTSKQIQGIGSTGTYTVTKDSASWAWEDVTAKAGVSLLGKDLDENTRNQDDIELMTQTTWNTTIVCVQELRKAGAGIVANLQMPYGAIAQNLTSSNAYKFSGMNTVYNVFEWLDEEGEFYFDKTEKKLYYYKRADENLSKVSVIVPKVDTIISIKGDETEVSNLSFEGLKFAYTDWNLCEVGGSHGRATNQGAASMVNLYKENSDGKVFHNSIYRAYDVGPGAVMVESAKNISFNNNVICHTGNDALSIVNDVKDSSFDQNIIYDIAGTSILVGHPQHMYIGDKGSDKGIYSDKEKYSAAQEALCESISLKNNYISNIGILFAGNPGVMIYAGKDITFEHNVVQNVPYSGISIGWGWWNLNGCAESVVPGEPMACMNNIKVKYNKFINCLTILSDGGAIYTLGDMPGSEISYNYIKDVAVGVKNPDADKIRGIHLDEGSAHIYGEKNVIDVDIKFACIDNGLWGGDISQHDNTWVENYTRNEKYTTWSWAPGSTVTDSHVSEDASWDENGQAIIAASGVEAAYLGRITEELTIDGSEFKEGKNLGLIIGLSVGGGVIGLSGLAVAVYSIVKKNKKKAKIETKIA